LGFLKKYLGLRKMGGNVGWHSCRRWWLRVYLDEGGNQRALVEGERMLLWFEGGSAIGCFKRFPPPLVAEVEGGVNVLVDARPREQCHCEFAAAL
jgi:hypothetical protein